MIQPVVERELRIAARRPQMYRMRIGTAVAAVVIAAWQLLSLNWQGFGVAGLGQPLFYVLSSLLFFYALLAGSHLTADCISFEKREGTLGLLFLTDLKGWDVILGKLAATSLSSFYGLLAVLPVLAIPVLLGGVTLFQFAQMALAIINTLFFSLAVGILLSSLSWEERRASFGTVLAVIIPILMPLALVFFLFSFAEIFGMRSGPAILLFILLISPIFPIVYVIVPVSGIPILKFPSWTFWVSIAVIHLLSWLALLLSARLLPRIWNQNTHFRWPAAWRRFGEMLLDRLRGRGLQYRKRQLDRNPYFWLVNRDRGKALYPWIFLFAVVLVWWWGYRRYRAFMLDFYPLVPTVMMIHLFLKLWVLSESSQRMVEDHRSGALELLLSTPLTLREIITGQRIALIRMFALPLLVLCVVELVGFRSRYDPETILLSGLVLIADCASLVWVGMYFGLSSKSLGRAIGWSIFWVMILPWLLQMFVAGIWGSYFFGSEPLDFAAKVRVWAGVSIAADISIVAFWVHPRMMRDFQSTTNGRFEKSNLEES